MLATQVPANHMASHSHRSSDVRDRSVAYAIPAQHERSRRYDTQAVGLTYAQHELLRQRKTPHGRLVEEHEAASLDKNLHLPALKHVILSRSPGYTRRDSDIQYEPWPEHNHADSFSRRCAAMPTISRPRQTWGTERQRPAWEFPGGMDSVLHQTQPSQGPRYYYHPGSHIPTVLPSTLHTHLGPTAPAGQQYYGPYWPDGTFTPYRPAPVRDSRFFERDFHFGQPSSTADAGHPTLRRPGRLPASQSLHMGYHNHTMTPPEMQHYRWPASNMIFEAQSYVDRSYHPEDQGPNTHNLSYASGLEEDRTRSSETIKLPSHLSSTLKPGPASDDVAFRDRTFSWAHSICVDMQSKMQHESKLGRTSGTLNHGRSLSKPAIFPKVPERLGSHFANTLAYNVNPIQQCERLSQLISHDNSTTVRPRTVNHISAQSGSEYGTSFPGSNQQYNDTPGGFAANGCSNVRRGSYPSAYQWHEHTPPFAAISALDTMEILCREASSPWTDGMLLAGCLAYGLGKYGKALAWYQAILAQDPRHVEAMSNLAATLLALNRRDEALQYWSASVKLRPSYFEAVEHLIGLLCSTHRAREAVSIIEYVESCLRFPKQKSNNDPSSDGDSDTYSRTSSTATATSVEQPCYDFDVERRFSTSSSTSDQQAAGFGSGGYAIPGSENGRLLHLIHAKGNMLYALGDNAGAAASFEDAVLLATEQRHNGIRGLIRRVLHSCVSSNNQYSSSVLHEDSKEPILLAPEQAQQTAQRMFPPHGELPGLNFVAYGKSHKAAISTTSNSLLSLAKIYQDGMGGHSPNMKERANGTREILALYYLSLSLQKSPSTANNVGILLASVQQSSTNMQPISQALTNEIISHTGIAPGSGISLALQYYNYGLVIDNKHAHLYTNLGSLLKDLGQLNSAIKMYTKAVECDPKFDIALANLANAVKDQGRIADAINYYERAVQANPDFAEAVCGLATALNSVCSWYRRGGVYADHGKRDRVHVDDNGMMHEARKGSGWMNRVVEIVERQLRDGETWGRGVLTPAVVNQVCDQLTTIKSHTSADVQKCFYQLLHASLVDWSGKRWEGARIVRLIERSIRYINWQWYQDRYKHGKEYPARRYARPNLPPSLPSPSAPTVLPFHTFTTPLSAKQVRQISQRNALRISVSTLRSPWLPATVYPPPKPPQPCLHVGYVSSDFNNHPLAHLMQSVFGLHDKSRVRSFCYATTSSDNSVHRQQIERESPVFHNAAAWPADMLVDQIVKDGIHILINLNGYTRGARNEVFAARPAPVHMSFMGFAGTLGAEWCDYVFADSISISPKTLSSWRRNVEIEDCLHPDVLTEDDEDWMYAENVIFAKSTFFCVDHKQSAPDARQGPPAVHEPAKRDAFWQDELERRWKLRKELFPTLSDTAVVLGNFNQLYKIDPATFRMYLRILAEVPNSILWLLRFPDAGEQNLMMFAREWAGLEVASRVIFTDVAPKEYHITRASVVDLFLDTPECNAHTTAADVIWSGTPIVTWARWEYKMCSRMASSIVASALPEGQKGDEARADLLVKSEEEYEQQAIKLANGLRYTLDAGKTGRGRGRLMDLRRLLWEGRWTSRLFDTARWVRDLEMAYWKAWEKWEAGEGGDIWL